jgi:hypothetical protein
MATLLPRDFDLSTLATSEQRVCAAFLKALDDTWYVVPNVPITVGGQDAEIDVVLASATHGVVCVEVKGGLVSLRAGDWHQYDRKIQSPVGQVMRAKHQLKVRCRTVGVDADALNLRHVVALPDVGEVPPEGLGADAPRDIVFAKTDLAFAGQALERLLQQRTPVAPAVLDRFLRLLRPDIELDGSEGRVLEWARTRLDDETRVHLTNVVGLDANQRVLVTGGAGTGKTMLVLEWAKRAAARGERTLVVCFNKPIANLLQQELADRDVMVSTFHDAALQLLEPHGFRIGESPSPEYWRDALTDALAFHAAAIGTPFDTVIVDEAQDFHPHWLAALERLLDHGGLPRFLLAADPAQAVYVTPWTAPADMVSMPLVYNLRNCGSIARVVQRLGGPVPLPSAPFGDAVVHLHAGGHKEIRKRVRDAVRRFTDEFHVPFSQIAVLTTRTDVRDELFRTPPEGCPLVSWEQRSEEAVLCETVHRAKGLERMAVVLVDMSGEPNPVLLYVGASRAVSALRLVGTPALAAACGVPAGASSSV